MAAVLNNAGAIEKITFFMEECKRMGKKVLGPDINESHKGFSVNKKGDIRLGLGGLKGVGEAAVESIIAEREANGRYTNIFDMIKRRKPAGSEQERRWNAWSMPVLSIALKSFTGHNTLPFLQDETASGHGKDH